MLDFLLPAGLLDGEPLNWFAFVSRAGEAGGAEAPRVLILESFAEGAAFVSRYAADFRYLTDTGYPSREAAVEDCANEFGHALGVWTPIPEGETNLEAYVRLQVAGHTSGA